MMFRSSSSIFQLKVGSDAVGTRLSQQPLCGELFERIIYQVIPSPVVGFTSIRSFSSLEPQAPLPFPTQKPSNKPTNYYHLTTSQPQTPPHIPPHPLLILAPLLPPHLRGLHVGRAFVVRLRQHGHDADEDLLDGLDGRPPLRSVLVVVRVVARSV